MIDFWWGETMTKEKLTLQRIKEDLKIKRESTYPKLFAALLFFLICLCAFIWGIQQHKEGILVYKVLMGVWLLCSLLFLLSIIVTIWRLRDPVDLQAVLVKDGVVDMERRDHAKFTRRRYRVYQTLHLLFAQYGEYRVLEGTYNYTRCGDEFYLVLSKPECGKILLAYHTDMYEWEE